LNLRQVAASKTAQELFDAMMATPNRRSVSADLSTYDPATNPTVGDQMPDYSQIFSEGQMWEIVKFLKSEAIDVSLLYDGNTTGTYPTGSMVFSNVGKDGSSSNGDIIYSDRCATCHGDDGALILVDGNAFTAGSFVRQKSNEAQHKIKFGQLGTGMIDMGLDLDKIKDIYKALANETKYPSPGNENPPQLAAADGIRGGRLYDKFWESDAGWDQNDPNLNTFSSFSNFFRCKQCHGWDLLGSQGAYISRAPRTSRPNVSDLDLKQMVAGMTPQQLFNGIKSQTGRRPISSDLSTYDPATNPTVGDQMPDYSEIMTDTDIWDLVKFLKYYAYDTDLFYDSATSGTYPDGSMSFTNIGTDGDAAAGAGVYASTCASCHGADGRLIIVDGEFSVGSYMRAKPNEAHHKFRYGVLGTAMINLGLNFTDIKNLYKALSDEGAFPDPALQASR
jgi:thiosulfate dehydrogenase